MKTDQTYSVSSLFFPQVIEACRCSGIYRPAGGSILHLKRQSQHLSLCNPHRFMGQIQLDCNPTETVLENGPVISRWSLYYPTWKRLEHALYLRRCLTIFPQTVVHSKKMCICGCRSQAHSRFFWKPCCPILGACSVYMRVSVTHGQLCPAYLVHESLGCTQQPFNLLVAPWARAHKRSFFITFNVLFSKSPGRNQLVQLLELLFTAASLSPLTLPLI